MGYVYGFGLWVRKPNPYGWAKPLLISVSRLGFRARRPSPYD